MSYIADDRVQHLHLVRISLSIRCLLWSPFPEMRDVRALLFSEQLATL